MQITLTPNQFQMAAYAGFLMRVENLHAGRRAAYGCLSGFDAQILGAVGEYVVSLGMGWPWDGPGRLRAPDVNGVDVRTSSRADGALIVHPRDPSDRAFILVTASPDPLTYHLRGWVWGREAKQRAYWADPAGGRAAYFVPQTALHPLAALGEVAACR